MIKKLLFSFAFLSLSFLLFSQTGTLKGTIKDATTQEPLPFVNIVIEVAGVQKGGAQTDFYGKYTIKPIPPGVYDVRASSVGFGYILNTGVTISQDQIRFLDIDMKSTTEELPTIEIIAFEIPLIEKDKTQSGATVTAAEISKMPVRNASGVAATVGGVYSEDGEIKSIRGQRKENTAIYIDGIRLIGSQQLPESAIGQVSVVLGGIPAQYGDVTGGIINVTTKGPSRKFSAGIDFQTSQFLDYYGYNRAGLNLNGPIFKNKEGVALLGYFVAGEAIFRQDNSPLANGNWVAQDDYLSTLEENPFDISENNIVQPNFAEYTTYDNLKHINSNDNANDLRFNLSGKFDVRTTETINLSFGGSMSYYNRDVFNRLSSMFNADNFMEQKSNTWRTFVKFSQRFKNATDADGIEIGTVKNIFYSVNVNYSNYDNLYQDPRHEDRLFDYGYIGKFSTHMLKDFQLTSDSIDGKPVYELISWTDTLITFERAELNPILANANLAEYGIVNSVHPINLVRGYYGLLNGQSINRIHGLFDAPGTLNIFDGFYHYYKSNTRQFGVNLDVSLDILNHEIKAGFQYEQRNEAAFGYNANGFWTTLLDPHINTHFMNLDLSNPDTIYEGDRVNIDYPWLSNDASQYYIDSIIRDKMGLDVNGTDLIDINSYDYNTYNIDYTNPDGERITGNLGEPLNINMFTADEILNNGNPQGTYYGYDYQGNRLSSKPSFNDFFRDEVNRPLPAFEPIYMAGYIQDKFAFDDLIFNIGVRIDRFDANQMVLKDPYLLSEAYTVGEKGSEFDYIPDNIGDDYILYVAGENDDERIITGFRNGQTWYLADGTEAGANDLSASGGVLPYLKQSSGSFRLRPEVFEDYEPQISVMPRISFSFPISDEALFFAHYDVLTQRPTTNLRSNLESYYYMASGSQTINNPNLKPEKTIDYEVGFQQKLSNTSSLKLSAFYKEVRDQIQFFRYTSAYPATYNSYNNIDFGTITGLTFAYDLRRTKNARVRASYTLQFADGTGSDANTARALVLAGQPNLRTLIPLNYDRRHAFNLVLDYRFSDGKKYTGPVIRKKGGGKPAQILKNTGFNITVNGGSGTPYTKSINIYRLGGGQGPITEGSLNGARMPGTIRFDLRVDKDFNLSFGNAENNDRRNASMNVYLQVLNLLDARNIRFVYPATGNSNDDGYLATTDAELYINSTVSSSKQAYKDLYSVRVNNPYNYSIPRLIRLGLSLNF